MRSPISAAELRALTSAAQLALQNAYAPYSGFRVGAALLLENGETVVGCNVENASFRLTACAEQTALLAAVARFGPTVRVVAGAVQNLAPDGSAQACTPCGACRQTLAEFAGPETPLLFSIADGATSVQTLGELLPASFALERPAR